MLSLATCIHLVMVNNILNRKYSVKLYQRHVVIETTDHPWVERKDSVPETHLKRYDSKTQEDYQ